MKEEQKYWELIEANEYDKALVVANQIANNDGSESLGHYLIGHYFYAIENVKEAEIYFRKSIEKGKAGDNVLAYSNYWLGILYKQYTEVLLPDSPYDFSKSRNFFRASLEFDFYPENTFNQLYHEIIRDRTNGLKTIEKAIKIHPENLDFKIARIDYFYNLKNNERVRELSSELFSVGNGMTYTAVPIYLSTFADGDYFDKFDKFDEIDQIVLNMDDDDSLLTIIKYEYARILHYTGRDRERAIEYFVDCCLRGTGTEKVNSFLFLADLTLRNETHQHIFRQLLSKVDATTISLYLDGPDFSYIGNPHMYFYPSSYNGKSLISLLRNVIKQVQDLEKGIVELLLAYIYYSKEELGKAFTSLLKAQDYLQHDNVLGEVQPCIHAWLESESRNYAEFITIVNSLSGLFEKSKKFREYFREYILDDFLEKAKELKNYSAYCKVLSKFPDVNFDSNQLFDYAYASSQAGDEDLAFELYSKYLDEYDESSAVLNNIANIYKSRGDVETAESLYQRAHVLSPNDSVINKNLEEINNAKTRQIEAKKYEKSQLHLLRLAADGLVNENDYVLNKLRTFISNWTSNPSFEDGKGPIPNFAFAKYMRADKNRADSLKKQFVDKDYLLETEERDIYKARIYKLNPHVLQVLKEIDSSAKEEMEVSWELAFQNISLTVLKELNYFETLTKISKINKKFSALVERDYKSLVLNYLMRQEKAVIVLSGSLVELALVYYFERKRIAHIKFTVPSSGKEINKSIYSANLIDMITYSYENNLFGTDFSHLSNLLRIYRNYIHPAVEIKQKAGNLDWSKAEMSFHGSIELLLRIIR